MTADQKGRQAILVLGMHRSGTSATTRVLNLLGASLNTNLLEPSLDNRKGFWESEDAVAIHERLFAALSRTWYDMRGLPTGWMSHPAARNAVDEIVELVQRDFEGTPLWAVKDPRMCLLVPLWLEALARLNVGAKALIVVRNPAEVSESLRVRNERERNQWDIGYSPLMWAQYLVEAEAATRDYRRTMLIYDDLLSDWRGAMARIAEELDIVWPQDVVNVGAEIDAFLDEGERHHYADFDRASASNAGQPPLVVRIYECCMRIARGGAGWDVLATLADEFRSASALYLGAMENLWRHYQQAYVRAAQAEENASRAQMVEAGKDNDLNEYRNQAETYDRLLREANVQIESLSEAHKHLAESTSQRHHALDKELEAYRQQALVYDELLREANSRAHGLAEDLARCSEGAASAHNVYEQEANAYRRQADKYDQLLRDANAQIASLSEAHKRLTESTIQRTHALEEELEAYRQQAHTYDDLLREANGRADGLAESLTRHSEQFAASGGAYQQEVAAYRQQAHNYDRLLHEANERIDACGQLERIQMEQLSAAHCRLAELEQNVELLRGQLERSRQSLADAESQSAALTHDNRRLSEALQRSNAQIEALKAIRSVPQKEFDELERRLRELREQRDIEMASIRFLGERLVKVMRSRFLTRKS